MPGADADRDRTRRGSEELRRVSLEEVNGPDDLVADALSSRMSGRPQLEVLKSVVEPVAVAVVDRLRGSQRPAKVASHDEPMLSEEVRAVREGPFVIVDGNVAVARRDPSA